MDYFIKLQNLYESFVSHQWFGACVKLPESRDFSRLRYVITVSKRFVISISDQIVTFVFAHVLIRH